MLALGILLFGATALWLVWLVIRGPRVQPYPHYGYLGLAVIGVAELLLWRRQPIVSTYFTPIAWTGYLAAVDAAVLTLSGRSLLRHAPRQFLLCAALSIPLWLVFEAYNLRLRNWEYVGLPAHWLPRYFGYAWSFATIWPAMLETSQLLRAARVFRSSATPVVFSPRALNAWMAAGAAMLAVPLLLPQSLGAYAFGLVWLGFIFLLEPVNLRRGAPSLLRDLAAGHRARLCSLLASGAVCGIFWEFWNQWAAARWIYIFPILQDWKIFQMPAPGFLGFPPFAVETFAMYSFTASFLDDHNHL
jgi:hypothetical protein